MPNWCRNSLVIEGSKKELKKFVDILEMKPKLIIEIPKDNLEERKDAYLKKMKDDKSWKKDLKAYLYKKKLNPQDFAKQVFGFEIDEKGNACTEIESTMIEKFYPTPPELLSNNNEGWYEWRIEHYGCKWYESELEINDSTDTSVSVSFETAWSPPTEWLRKVAKDYPKLTFELDYEESGMCFKGLLRVKGKEIQEDSIREWFGECYECDKEYDGKGKCDCENHTWGEEDEEGETEETTTETEKE